MMHANPQRSTGLKSTIAALLLVALGVISWGALGQQAAVLERSMLDEIYGPYAYIVRQIAAGLWQITIVILVVLPFQALWPAVRRRPKLYSYEYWLDIVYNCQSLWWSLLSIFVAVNWLAGAIFGNQGNWFPQLAALPFWLQVLLAVWAYDFVVYWRHRFEHTFSALWSFHAVHHTAEKVDVLTTSRLHPLELMFGALLNAIVIRAGFHPGAAGIGFTIYLHYNYFVHTNVRIRFPGLLKYLFVSPFMHHWHHAKDEAAAGKNVGVVFAWNDWLFGTAYHPEHWPTSFGFTSPEPEQVGQSYVRQMLYPLQYFFARFVAWRDARAAS